MKRVPLLIFLLLFSIKFLLVSFSAKSPYPDNDLYLVYFTDKKGVDFNPYEYFHPKAIDRRLKNNIDLYDITDFPVNESYIDKVSLIVDSVSYATRWLNGLFVYAAKEQVQAIKELDFVKKAEKLTRQKSLPAAADKKSLISNTDISEQRWLMKHQTKHLNGHEFYNRRINGSGIRIALFDAGFPGVNKHNAFKHLMKERRIVAVWDFHKSLYDVFKDHVHGTNVLSAVGGYFDSIPLGLATGAEFLLARTEIRFEFYFEEKYWLAAAEWADKNGAHIINTSVGYTYHRYFPEQMDGKTSLVSKAARMAARKGILVVAAAGNEGSKDEWQTICTPADADSILTVGAINPNTMLVADYSSKGPTADKRKKPNVSAFGTVVAAGETAYSTPSGTSFSSPLIAGFAACIMQMHPDWTNIDVIEQIQKSASLYPYYDYSHGYGIPNANFFLNQQKIAKEPTFEFVINDDSVDIIIDDDFSNINKPMGSNILYLHITNNNDEITEYFVVDVYQKKAFSIDLEKLKLNNKIRAHYMGYTSEITIE